MSRVCIILVNWNGWLDTIECLESLLQLDYPDFRIVVCDNGSDDDSLKQIRSWANDHVVSLVEYRRDEAEAGGSGDNEQLLTLVSISENLGFAGGNNVGLRYGSEQGDFSYFWLLNNDTTVVPDTLTHLVAQVQMHPEIGICGSTILHYNDHSCILALGGGYYCRWLGVPWHYGRFTRWSRAINHQRAEAWMNYVEGASMLVSRPFLERIGLICEDYFLYFEEADWAIRAKGQFRLGYAPESIVYHKVGASIGTSSNPARKSRLCDYYSIRNRILFTRRYFPFALPTVYLVLVVELLLRLLCGRPRRTVMIVSLMLSGGRWCNKRS